jgi:hypothetical protein
MTVTKATNSARQPVHGRGVIYMDSINNIFLHLRCRKFQTEQFKVIFNGDEVSVLLDIVPHFTRKETSAAPL